MCNYWPKALRDQRGKTGGCKRGFLQIGKLQQNRSFAANRGVEQIALLDQLQKIFIGKILACQMELKRDIVLLQCVDENIEGGAQRYCLVIENPMIEMRRKDSPGKPKIFEFSDGQLGICVGRHAVIDQRQEMAMKIQSQDSRPAASRVAGGFCIRGAPERKFNQVNLLRILFIACRYLPTAVLGCGVSP